MNTRRRFPMRCVVGLVIVVAGSLATARTAVAQTAAMSTVDSASDWRRPWYNDHEVRLASDGMLPLAVKYFDEQDQLAPAAGRPVVFMRDGRVYGADRKWMTNADGVVQADVEPGIYSIAVGDLSDQYGFAFTTVRVSPHQAPPRQPSVKHVADGNVLQSPPRLEICLIRLTDVRLMRALIRARMLQSRESATTSSGNASVAPRPLSSLLGRSDATFPTRFASTSRAAEAYENRWDAVPYDGPWHFNHEILLNADHGLRGKLRTFDAKGELRPVADAEIWFVSDGVPQKMLPTDADGTFRAESVSPGVYSIIAANGSTFGCYGVQITSPFVSEPAAAPAPPVKNAAFIRNVVLNQPPGDTELQSTVGTEENSAGFLNTFGTGAGDGALAGAAGAGGGAGVGGAGGSGLAALAAADAGAGLGYALADEGYSGGSSQ